MGGHLSAGLFSLLNTNKNAFSVLTQKKLRSSFWLFSSFEPEVIGKPLLKKDTETKQFSLTTQLKQTFVSLQTFPGLHFRGNPCSIPGLFGGFPNKSNFSNTGEIATTWRMAKVFVARS